MEAPRRDDVDLVVDHVRRTLPSLKTASLSESYFYQSIPLCIIDAVWSLGAKYESVKNVVGAYCGEYGVIRYRDPRSALPPIEQQHSVSEFCKAADQCGSEAMATEIFKNRQRTSARGGILKAEAVHLFAKVLRGFGVDYLQDVPRVLDNKTFERDIRNVPGQTSGKSLDYFFMLSGSDNLIKLDRRIETFLRAALPHKRIIDREEVLELLTTVVQRLQSEYPNLTPRLLDHEIWKYQREKKD